MSAATVRELAAQPGIGAANVWSACLDVDATARAAGIALDTWATVNGRHPRDFPYDCVHQHLLVTGRLDAHPAVVQRLQDEYARLSRSPGDTTDPDEGLRRWLASAADQNRGNYDTFVAVPYFETVERVPGDPERVVAGDHLLAGLTHDLCVLEHDPALCPEGREVNLRRAAVRRLAEEHVRLAPTAPPAIAPSVHVVVRRSLLPLTNWHDELMFLRCVQMFELIYRQTFRLLSAAVDAAARDRPDVARACLRDSARRLTATRTVYRVLTQIPPSVFGQIRSRSDGRSALQSRYFQLIQELCSRDCPTPPGLPRLWFGSTLEDVLIGGTARIHRDGLAEDAERFADAWTAMKRTHWGIARKVIGSVDGTGGTTGVSYLKSGCERPLLPNLVRARS